MKFVAQRVASAALCVSGELVSEIGRGLVVYLGVKAGDNEKQAEKAMEKVALLRVFEDEAGKMNRSLLDIGGEALIVSQFTLYADTSRGNRPGFTEAEDPAKAETLYLYAAEALGRNAPVKKGVFGADMKIEQVNDGPFTLVMEKRREE